MDEATSNLNKKALFLHHLIKKLKTHFIKRVCLFYKILPPANIHQEPNKVHPICIHRQFKAEIQKPTLLQNLISNHTAGSTRQIYPCALSRGERAWCQVERKCFREFKAHLERADVALTKPLVHLLFLLSTYHMADCASCWGQGKKGHNIYSQKCRVCWGHLAM